MGKLHLYWLACLALYSGATVAQYPTNTVGLGEQQRLVTWRGIIGHPEFHVVEGSGIVTLRSNNGDVTPIRVIEDVSDAVAILADKRLATVQAPLLTWAGNDLVELRDKAISRAKAAAELGLPAAIPRDQSEQWSGGGALAAELQYARALARAGRVEDAISIIKLKIRTAPMDDDKAYIRVFLTVRLASMLFDSGHEDEAISLLIQDVDNTAIDSSYRANIGVNLAWALARRGRYAEALRRIDDEWAAFGKASPDVSDSSRVPDSEANFASIRACALSGLHRPADAKFLIDGIDVTKSDSSALSVPAQARINYFLCTHDPAGLALELTNGLSVSQPGDDIFHELQPQSERYLSDRTTLSLALKEPALAKVAAAQTFDLGPDFAPVNGRWLPFVAMDHAKHS